MALYVKLDTGWLWNRHMVTVGPLARLLYLGGLSYCVEHLTDGEIPKAVLQRIADVDDTKPSKTAAVLVEAGRWIDKGGCWVVHDYLEHQSAAEDVSAKREKWAAKKRRQRGDSPTLSPGDSKGDSKGESLECPYIEPEPEPEISKSSPTTPIGLVPDRRGEEETFESPGKAAVASGERPLAFSETVAAVALLAASEAAASEVKIRNKTAWLRAAEARIASERGEELDAATQRLRETATKNATKTTVDAADVIAEADRHTHITKRLAGARSWGHSRADLTWTEVHNIAKTEWPNTPELIEAAFNGWHAAQPTPDQEDVA